MICVENLDDECAEETGSRVGESNGNATMGGNDMVTHGI